MTFRGLTWDHPRGREALQRVALAAGDLITWDVHPLEGFESSSIADLAKEYDVIVLDHPHLGDALAADCLRPVDDWIDPPKLRDIAADALGPSFESYCLDGKAWALPLDTAAQVSARLPERVSEAPQTWDQVLALSLTDPVALNLGGPHALLSYFSICVALGEAPAVDGSLELVPETVGVEAISMMQELAARAPSGTAGLNPIALLERMRDARDIAYVPLVYGYVNYASGAEAVTFGNAPEGPAGLIGSVIGGTGLALTTRSAPDARLVDMLAWLMHPLTQATVLPEHSGQPGSQAAWSNDEVNRLAAGFYSATQTTLEASWVRPRLPRYTAFQGAASGILRDSLLPDHPRTTWQKIQHEYERTLAGAPEHRHLQETR